MICIVKEFFSKLIIVTSLIFSMSNTTILQELPNQHLISQQITELPNQH
jgi:hypothetical protein